MTEISEDEKIWGFIAWVGFIVGAIIALALKPTYRYSKYWAYLSISFTIAIVLGAIVLGIVTAVLNLIPFVGWLISGLLQGIYGLVILVAWIFGIIKSLGKELWRPPIIYEIAKYVGIEKI
ncbi:MAG: hypothetical protein B7O98_07865 [Zestosphaera tikiterensis]|uniref:DUF4870 domain-containing protein n=1 Tax=Zestosphaera tikiterensis TaxID=1973259 RepID=A0A2R7Y4Z6_9CREN|nr:MAG: hypothetical protein B7O98_07865 [Zestosphaera tikiterensis]